MSTPVTDSTFEDEVLKSDRVVLVDFWAEWCAPCKMVAPVVAELAQEYDGKLKVVSLDVDSNARTSAQYGIMSIPSLLFFKDGKVIDQVVGAVPKRVFVDRLDRILS